MAKVKKTAAPKKNKPEDQLVETNDNSTDPRTENESEETLENGEVDSEKKKGHLKKPDSISESEEKEEDSPEENGEEVDTKEEQKKPTPKKTKAAKKTPSKTISEPERKSSRTPKTVKSEEEESHEEQNKKKSPTKRLASETSLKSPAKKAKKEDKDYEVEAIVGMRTKKGKKQFQIRWKGYKPSDDTWEPEEHLSCQDLIDQYLEEHKDEAVEKEKKPRKKENSSAKPVTTKSGRRAKK